jgi:streptomycin 6-kinase
VTLTPGPSPRRGEERSPHDVYARDLTPEFRRHFVEVFGEGSEQWLDALPDLLRSVEQRWKLRLEPPFPLSYGYVAPATLEDRTPVVLKARFPNSEARDEIEALRAFAGDAAVRLLDADADGCLMLLERIMPGTMLKELVDDDEATRIAARIMVSLRRLPPEGNTFPSVRTWWLKAASDIRARFDGGCGPMPADLFARAEATFLEGETDAWLLLHGDVHHENILLDERRGWLVIDPQGVIGDPAYEAGTYLANQLLHRRDPRATLARRVELLTDGLVLDRARIIEWSLAQAVMSGSWTLESHGEGWERAIQVAEMLRDLQTPGPGTDR